MEFKKQLSSEEKNNIISRNIATKTYDELSKMCGISKGCVKKRAYKLNKKTTDCNIKFQESEKLNNFIKSNWDKYDTYKEIGDNCGISSLLLLTVLL